MLRTYSLLLVLVAATAVVYGQGNTGTILGTVTDTSNAVAPAVQIRVVNEDTGVVTPAQTDNLGNYRAQFLPPGPYRVEAETGGFKKFVRQGVRLEMNRELRIDIVLEPGVVSEQITVSASVPLVETETGTLSTVMENQLVTSLPMIGRDPMSLRKIVPGATGTNISAGGLEYKDRYLIDGANVSLHVFGGQAVNPNPDVIEEFKIITNSFSAEYGQVSGFLMQAVTKSGTNAFHGTLFEFLRNDKLNAGNYYSHQRSVLRYNQFGGTVGGPIRRNKTFFFADAQLRRQSGISQGNNLTVPIDDVKQGDFSSFLGAQAGTDALGRPVYRNQIFDPLSSRTVRASNGRDVVVRDPFDRNRIPASRMSPAALKVQALWPKPKIGAPFANYSYFGANRNNEDAYNLKIDHNFSEKDKLTARYSFREINNAPPQPLSRLAGGGGAQGPTYERGQQLVLNEVHVFGPRTTNDFHAYAFRRNIERVPAGFGEIGTEDLGIFGMPNGKEKLGTPMVNFNGLIRPVALGNAAGTLILEPQHSMAVVNVTSLIRDRHTIKFGGEIHRLRIDNLQPYPYNTQFTFSNSFTDQVGFAQTGIDYASFLLGLPVDLAYTIQPSFIQPRTAVYALFVQDDIRVGRNLTINAGLRWDAPLLWHEKRNRTGVFDLDKGEYVRFGQGGFRTTNSEQDVWNFGPRLGFAYTPAGPKTVIRGAYALFTVGQQGSGRAGSMVMSPLFSDGSVGRYTSTDRITWKTTLDRIPYQAADKTGRNAAQVTTFPANSATAYFQHFSFSVQRQVLEQMVEVAYVGTRGVHLPYGTYNWNAIPTSLAAEAQGRFVTPYIRDARYPSGININTPIGSSIYHSLQAKVERRLKGGLSLLGAYTWAKMIATGDNDYRAPLENRNLDRGVPSSTPPHRLTIAYVYQLPWGSGRRWLTQGPASQVLGGWEVSGITTLESGYYLTPTSSYDSCLCGAATAPQLIGNPRLSSAERSLDRWFNTSAFAFPALYTVGNSGRGLFLGPGTVNFDLALMKRFRLSPLGDRANLEFRSEFFGLTNSPQWGNPNVAVGAGNFGRINSASGARQIQMALKLYW